jgi:hypothetical protein
MKPDADEEQLRIHFGCDARSGLKPSRWRDQSSTALKGPVTEVQFALSPKPGSLTTSDTLEATHTYLDPIGSGTSDIAQTV